MSAVRWTMNSGSVALAAATAKTVLSFYAASNHRALLKRLIISFDGTAGDAVPVLVELQRNTNAGTGTAGTPQKVDPDMSETLQTDFVTNCTVEPTGQTNIYSWLIHPQTGVDIILPFDGGYPIPGGDFAGIRVTAPAVVNVRVCLDGEE